MVHRFSVISHSAMEVKVKRSICLNTFSEAASQRNSKTVRLADADFLRLNENTKVTNTNFCRTRVAWKSPHGKEGTGCKRACSPLQRSGKFCSAHGRFIDASR